tara:strand:+ start:5598 stop:6083 length:486 start_codon:yes stop_codon:yes gene_type:complete
MANPMYGANKLDNKVDALVTAYDSENVLLSNRVKVAEVALSAADTSGTTAGALFTWQNNEGVSVIVTKVVIDATTQASGSLTVDIGSSATVANSDNIFTALDLGAAAGTFGSDDPVLGGTNTRAASTAKVANGKYILGTNASGDSTGLVGTAYIFYYTLAA